MTAAVLVAGEVTRLSARVRRVIAPNPGRMTGPGTNSYLLQAPDGHGPVVIIDAGPDRAEHTQRLLAASAQGVMAYVVTHTHSDHSPAVATLHRAQPAPRHGLAARHADYQDASFTPDVPALADARLTGRGFTLRAVPTPGHASNHVCWLLEEEGLLFTGDHVLGTVSPVILAPDGHMGDYLASLRRLLDLPLRALAPGHGPLLEEPARVIQALIAHRLAREAKVVAALGRLGCASLAALLPLVYDDVDPQMHVWARYSLEAHLIKLGEDGLARAVGPEWCAGAP